MTFGEVDVRAERVAILGQGPSFGLVPRGKLRRSQAKGVCVVAVNGAIDSFPEADLWFSLDFSNENRLRVADPVPGVRYFAAVPPGYEKRGPVFDHVTYLRRVVRKEPRNGPFAVRVFEQIVGGLSEDPGAIHTGNSAFGALGLAYLMGAKKVGLFGVDGIGRKRWDGTGNGYLGHLPELFSGAVEQLGEAGVLVANGSERSAVSCFPKLSPREAIEWLQF